MYDSWLVLDAPLKQEKEEKLLTMGITKSFTAAFVFRCFVCVLIYCPVGVRDEI